MGLPLEGIPATWGDYEAKFISTLKRQNTIWMQPFLRY
jgi:hypothetical protein